MVMYFSPTCILALYFSLSTFEFVWAYSTVTALCELIVGSVLRVNGRFGCILTEIISGNSSDLPALPRYHLDNASNCNLCLCQGVFSQSHPAPVEPGLFRFLEKFHELPLLEDRLASTCLESHPRHSQMQLLTRHSQHMPCSTSAGLNRNNGFTQPCIHLQKLYTSGMAGRFGASSEYTRKESMRTSKHFKQATPQLTIAA